MHFVLRKTFDLNQVVTILRTEYLPISRFTIHDLDVGMFRRACGHAVSLNIMGVRLLRKKFYCGQHAGPCQVRFGGNPPHKLSYILEGADWVGFNDMLNDVCDEYRIEADIWSERESIGRLYLRRGRSRCIYYGGDHRTGQHWQGNVDRVSEFADGHFGKKTPAKRAEFQDGTPGIPEWLKARELLKKYVPIFEHEGKTRRQVREMAGHRD